MSSRKAYFEKKRSWKKILMYTLPVVFLIIGGLAYMTNAGTDESSMIDQKDKSFLLEVADIRMMDWAEGNLAAERGTSPYRIYGKRLMHDQDKIMKDLRTLAGKKELPLPDKIGEERTEGLAHLEASKGGEWFDRRFRRMIIKDHKHDIRIFQEAKKSKDADISNFAKHYLPVLEQHLQMARDLP